MQARWLLRPIMGIWNKYVKGAKVERDILAIPPPLTDAVDIAAPTHLVQVRKKVREKRSCALPRSYLWSCCNHLTPYLLHVHKMLPFPSMLQVRAIDAEPTFSHELHEAAYEGGQLWIERLVEEEGVAPDTKDQVCVSISLFRSWLLPHLAGHWKKEQQRPDRRREGGLARAARKHAEAG